MRVGHALYCDSSGTQRNNQILEANPKRARDPPLFPAEQSDSNEDTFRINCIDLMVATGVQS
jgi:hypothetical protein